MYLNYGDDELVQSLERKIQSKKPLNAWTSITG